MSYWKLNRAYIQYIYIIHTTFVRRTSGKRRKFWFIPTICGQSPVPEQGNMLQKKRKREAFAIVCRPSEQMQPRANGFCRAITETISTLGLRLHLHINAQNIIGLFSPSNFLKHHRRPRFVEAISKRIINQTRWSWTRIEREVFISNFFIVFIYMWKS